MHVRIVNVRQIQTKAKPSKRVTLWQSAIAVSVAAFGESREMPRAYSRVALEGPGSQIQGQLRKRSRPHSFQSATELNAKN